MFRLNTNDTNVSRDGSLTRCGGSNLLATYSYNPDSTIDSILYGTGLNTEYGYDRDKNITGLTHKNPQNGVINSFAYTYDNNGNQLTKTENGAATTYTYDELNRLATVDYPSIGTETYTYDNAGNRLNKVLGSQSTNYSYDARNRLTQSVTKGTATAYDYDNNGNLLRATKGSEETTYTYDGFNRLKEVNMPDGTWMNNFYDASGMRVAAIENSLRSDFTIDRGNVIAEASSGKNIRYIRGLGLVANQENQGDCAYYLNNAHGDVVNLVNGNGEILNSYAYDAFGNAATYAETVSNRFTYAGEQFDKVTGQYYLRARYYAPEIGRFITEDTYRGDVEDASTLNLYAYCHNNPVNNIDPTGHWSDFINDEIASIKLKSIIYIQYPLVAAAKVGFNIDRADDSINKVLNNKCSINSIGKKYNIPSEIIAGIIIKEQLTQSLPDEVAVVDTLLRGSTHSVGLGAIFPKTAREAWENVNAAVAKNLPKSDKVLELNLYMNQKFNIETIAVVLTNFARNIYGNNVDVSKLNMQQWEPVVGRYNASGQAKAQAYSNKVYQYLNPLIELLDKR